MGQIDFSSQFGPVVQNWPQGHRTELTQFVKDCLEKGSNRFFKPIWPNRWAKLAEKVIGPI
jgi:hypothetical protein